MNYQEQESAVERFLRNGWLITNNAEQLANVIMELKDKNVKFQAGDAGDCKYCIIKVK
jgi:hypothetical protein